MVKLVENTEETVHAKKLLDELRSRGAGGAERF